MPENNETITENIPTAVDLDNDYKYIAEELGRVANQLIQENPTCRELMGRQRAISEFKERLYGSVAQVPQVNQEPEIIGE